MRKSLPATRSFIAGLMMVSMHPDRIISSKSPIQHRTNWRDTQFDWPARAKMDPATDYPLGYAIQEDQCRSEWIDWEDDPLSARWSWSSQVHHELAPLPHSWGLLPNDGLFMYLNSYLDFCDACPWTGLGFVARDLDEPVPSRLRRGSPPSPPYAATPWQRVRDLHLRRPDLEFPDRAIYRPRSSG